LSYAVGRNLGSAV